MSRVSVWTIRLLLATNAGLMALAIWMIFLFAPAERVMGPPQRIFYFHVPLAILTFVSVFVLLAGSVGYLWTRRAVWDHLGRAATELGWLGATLVLVTGPIWAKPAWGIWWTWEAKLTTTLVLWLLLAGCLLVRAYAENREQGARFASVLGVIAALDVPIIYRATEWWRGQHPVVFGPGKKDPLAPGMTATFLVSLTVFFLLFALLATLRVRLASLEDRAAALQEDLGGR